MMIWTPARCRWDPENPPEFSLALNLLFGFVGSLPPSKSKSSLSIWYSTHVPIKKENEEEG